MSQWRTLGWLILRSVQKLVRHGKHLQSVGHRHAECHTQACKVSATVPTENCLSTISQPSLSACVVLGPTPDLQELGSWKFDYWCGLMQIKLENCILHERPGLIKTGPWSRDKVRSSSSFSSWLPWWPLQWAAQSQPNNFTVQGMLGVPLLTRISLYPLLVILMSRRELQKSFWDNKIVKVAIIKYLPGCCAKSIPWNLSYRIRLDTIINYILQLWGSEWGLESSSLTAQPDLRNTFLLVCPWRTEDRPNLQS